MKGLCQKCHSSNVEVTLQEGIPICAVCYKKQNNQRVLFLKKEI